MVAAPPPPPPPPLVVFASERTGISQVYAVRADGRGLRQLTFGSVNACAPRPAAKGTVGFDMGSGYCAGTLARSTLRGRVVASQPGYHGAWSPDGTLAYVDGNTQDLVVAGHPIWSQAWEPAWSSTGRLAFFAWRDGLVIAMHASRPAVIDRRLDAAGLTWSPDGAHLAYRFRDDQPSSVGIAVDGREVFAAPAGDVVGPTWSADGRRLAFAIGGDLDVVDLHRRVRTIAALSPTAVAWSPRGDLIAAADADGIETVGMNGSVRRVFTDPDNTTSTLFWLQPPANAMLRTPQARPRLVAASPNVLQARDALGDVVASGNTVAYTLCRGVHTWTPGVAPMPPSEVACGDEGWLRVLWDPHEYALADGFSVTLEAHGGNNVIWQLVVRRSGSATVVLEGDDQYAGDPTIPTVRHLLGAGDSVVFSRFTRCGSAGCGDALNVGGYNPNFVASTTIYRIGPDGRAVAIATAPGAYEPLAFDGSHIVVRRHLTGIDVLDVAGAKIASFEAGGRVEGAALDGSSTYALVDGGRLFDVDVAGSLVRTMQLPGDAVLAGAADGEVAFVSGGSAYVETAATGRTCPLGPATSVALTRVGAFVGLSSTEPWKSSIRFVSFSDLRC